MSAPEILFSARNEELGVEAQVFLGRNGYTVRLLDLDSESVFPCFLSFPKFEDAQHYAEKSVI